MASILSGSVVGQGIVMLAYPALTRLYDPAEFGLLTVFSSVVGIVSIVSGLTLDRAIAVPPDDSAAADVAWTALAAVVLTTLLTGAAGLVVADPIARALDAPRLADYWWLVTLTVLVLGTYQVLSSWMVRERSYAALGTRNVLLGVGQVAAQLGLGLLQVRPLGLLLGPAAGRLSALGGLLSRDGLLRRPLPRPAALRAALRRFRRFPLLSTPAALVNTVGLEAPLLIISALYGNVTAGLLGLTARVLSAPIVTLGNAVAQVFTGESSAAVREQAGTLVSRLRSTVRRLLLVGLLPTAVLVAFGPWLFGTVFGPEWTQAGEFARYLAISYLAQFAVVPVSGIMQFLERQGQSLGWASFRLVLTVGGPLACALLGAPVAVAVASLAAANVIGYVVQYVLCLRAARASDAQHRDDQRDEPQGRP